MLQYNIRMRYHDRMKVHRPKSLEETGKIAAEWLRIASTERDEADSAFVAGLSGHLGAGKTAFTKLLAKELGIEEEITSPTFVLMKVYDIKNDVFKRLVHIDAYRLEKRSELEGLRYEEIVADKNSLVIIEWPENVGLNSADLDALLRFEIREGAHTISV